MYSVLSLAGQVSMSPRQIITQTMGHANAISTLPSRELTNLNFLNLLIEITLLCLLLISCLYLFSQQEATWNANLAYKQLLTHDNAALLGPLHQKMQPKMTLVTQLNHLSHPDHFYPAFSPRRNGLPKTIKCLCGYKSSAAKNTTWWFRYFHACSASLAC